MSVAPQRRKKKAAAGASSKAPTKSKKKAATRTTSKAPAKSKKKAASKATSKAPATGKTNAARKTKAPARQSPVKPRARKKSATTVKARESGLGTYGVAPYKPKKNEEYMSDGQLDHFRTILENWKREILEEVKRTIHHLRDEAGSFADPNDRATQETERGLELRTRDRERKLIRKIDAALERISQGTYGYCEETGEEIGLARLEARPITTMCLEAQERHEKTERGFGNDES